MVVPTVSHHIQNIIKLLFFCVKCDWMWTDCRAIVLMRCRSSGGFAVSGPDQQCSYVSACKPRVSTACPLTCSVRARTWRRPATECWRYRLRFVTIFWYWGKIWQDGHVNCCEIVRGKQVVSSGSWKCFQLAVTRWIICISVPNFGS